MANDMKQSAKAVTITIIEELVQKLNMVDIDSYIELTMKAEKCIKHPAQRAYFAQIGLVYADTIIQKELARRSSE